MLKKKKIDWKSGFVMKFRDKNFVVVSSMRIRIDSLFFRFSKEIIIGAHCG